jgi:hypothetical protein
MVENLITAWREGEVVEDIESLMEEHLDSNQEAEIELPRAVWIVSMEELSELLIKSSRGEDDDRGQSKVQTTSMTTSFLRKDLKERQELILLFFDANGTIKESLRVCQTCNGLFQLALKGADFGLCDIQSRLHLELSLLVALDFLKLQPQFLRDRDRQREKDREREKSELEKER